MTADGVYWMFAGFAGVLGLLFGSFLNVCIARMPEDRSVVYPGSSCPRCGTAIKPYDNVPVFAWFWLGGKCRACKSPISALYPAIEALFAVLTVLLFRRVIPDLGDLDKAHLVALVWYGWLLFGLIALSVIDLRHFIIPDEFSLYTVPVGVLGVVFLGSMGYTGVPTWQGSLLGALIGGGCLWLLARIWTLLRKELAMGDGDLKLLAAYGAYFGPLALFPILMVASIAGSSLGMMAAAPKATQRTRELIAENHAAGRSGPLTRLKAVLSGLSYGGRHGLPFGPFLALGAGVWLYAGPSLEPKLVGWVAPLMYVLSD